ncbi:hypothetical protein AAG906_004782 [Vitis piasezkii]
MYSATYRAASDPTTYCNPYAHIKEFEDACSTFREGGTSINLMRLNLFPFTLKDKAKKFFPTHRTNGLKRQISNFSAKENEKFYECWEIYIAINACPHHGFDTWLLVSYFYDGMSSSMKQLLETMCGGDFMSKNPEEAMDFLSYSNAREVGRRKSQPNAFNAKAGMYTLNEDTDMKAKFAAMARRLEELEVKKICECPMMPVVREMFGDQANVIGQFKPNNNASYGNTYNSNWRNHPNFSWKPRAPQYTQPGQAPPQASNLEQAIVNLSKVREVKAVITLRSGKEVDLPTSKPEQEPESEAEKEKREEIKGKRKWNNAKKEDLEANVNEKPERTVNQEK